MPLFGALLAVLLLGAASNTSSAYALSSYTDAEKAAIDAWGYKGSAVTSAVPSCESVCSDLWLAEHRPIPGQPSSKALWRELRMARFRAGLVPGLGTVIGGITLGPAAFHIGWRIGTGIRGLFEGVDLPADPTPNTSPINLTFVAEDDAVTAYSAASGRQEVIGHYLRDYLRYTTYATQAHLPGDVNWTCNDAPPPAGDLPGSMTELVFPIPQEFNNCKAFDGNWVARQGTLHVLVQALDGRPPTDHLPDDDGWMPDTMPASNTSPATTWKPWDSAGPTTYGVVDPFPGGSLATEIQAHPERYPNLKPWLDSQLEGARPITVPDCAGQTGQACVDTLTAQGFKNVTLDPLDWQHAQLDKPALAWVSTSPAPGQVVSPGEAVVVRANPAQVDMPLVVPAPQPGESGEHYRQRLRDAGFPDAKIAVVILTDATLNPDLGPDTVTRVEPKPGTRSDPHSPPATSVYVNPPTAPPVDGSGGVPGSGDGGCDRPPIRDFALRGPLASIPRVFPFGIPFWIADALGGFSAPGSAPAFDIDVPWATKQLHVDLAWTQPIVSGVRPVILVCAAIGMLVALANLLGRFWVDRKGRGDG